MNTAIIIPAYEPDEKLIKLLNELTAYSYPLIVIVNDGSSGKCSDIFTEASKYPNCKVLHHEINKGKGAALKTGMKAILETGAGLAGCITVDADGQHLPEDIAELAKAFERNSSSLVLGCRDFNKDIVPLKSRLGNKITRAVYKMTTGLSVTDTQTGLRAIPLDAVKSFLNLPGDRYEFEMNILMQASKSNMPIKEVTIQTVYIDQNRSSHFNPLLDSARIYKEILKFSFSSLFCGAVDISLFTLIYNMLTANHAAWPLLAATGIARLISSGINFTLNRKIVFENNEAIFLQALKYYMLCAAQMTCSWLLLEGMTRLGLGHAVILKIIADTFLFAVSFAVQRLFIFRRKLHHEKAAGVF